MSAIGNYVHYNASRYMKYGISPKSNQGKNVDVSLWQRIRNETYQKAKSRSYSNTEVQDIEDKYNAYRKLIAADTGFEKVREKIIQLMQKQFFKNINVDFETGNVSKVSINSQQVQRNITSMQNPRNIKNLQAVKDVRYAQTVLDRFTEAYNSLQKINSVTTRQKAFQLLQNAEMTFLKMVTEEDKIIKEQKLVGIHISKEAISKATAEKAIITIRNIVGTNSSLGLGKALGTFEEYIGHAVNLMAQGIAADEIVKNIENEFKQHGGGQHTQGTINSDLAAISQKAAAALKNVDTDAVYQDETSTYHYKTNYHSEQKADVKFIYDLKNQKSVGLSIKNYNLYVNYPIKLVTQSPLSVFLFNMDNTDYTNHFLNILAKHENTPSAFRNCRKVAETSLAYYLLWAAMSGKGVGKKEGTADIFVVKNNKEKNGVKMWDIGELVNKIIQKNNLETDLIIDEPLSSIHLTNKWQNMGHSIGDNIQRRITTLIANVHSHKINVAINPQVLQY